MLHTVNKSSFERNSLQSCLNTIDDTSVIVLDNASYHNIKTEETVVPNFNQRKAVLQDYLSNGLPLAFSS
jgi:sulfur transfer complex TusBCD TusB component (DsrH family)